MALTGEDIVNALNDLKSPASITAIVSLLSSKNKSSATTLSEAAKDLIEAGLKFGCIMQEGNKFRCKEQIKGKQAVKEIQKVVKSNNEHRSLHSLSEDDEESDGDLGDPTDCYGPNFRRRRSRSRSRPRSRRSRSGKRRSSRRRRTLR